MTGDVGSPGPTVKRELEAEDGAELQAAEAPAREGGVKAELHESTRRRLGKKTSSAPAGNSKRSGKRRLNSKSQATARVKTLSSVKTELRPGKAAAPSRRFRLRRKAVSGKSRLDKLAKPEIKAELREREEEVAEQAEPAKEDTQIGKKAKQELGEQNRVAPARGKAQASRRSGSSCGIKGEIKTEPQEPLSFEARLPFFLAQCRAFQLAKRTWKIGRPCCLANCLLEPRVGPREGGCCYERLSKEKKSRFKRLVDAPDAEARASRGQVSLRTFAMLLHPERAPNKTSVRRKSLDAESEHETEARVPIEAFGGTSQVIAMAVARAKARQERLEKQAVRSGKKLSGVRGVSWSQKSKAWVATWQDIADGTKRQEVFPVKFHTEKGRSPEDACKEAMEEAIVFRERLLIDGKCRAPPEDNVNRGLTWNKKRGGWDVCVRVHGQKLRGGFFRPLENTPDSVEKARQLAAECRRQLEEKFGKYGQQIQEAIMRKELERPPQAGKQQGALKVPKQQREEPVRKAPRGGASAAGAAAPAANAAGVPSAASLSRGQAKRRKDSHVGVTWRRHGCHWRVHMYVNGKLDRRLFKRKEDRTPEEVERELLAACGRT